MQFYSDRVTDQYGNVKASASVSVLLNGLPATIYSDDGVTTQANPITTASDGSFSFYAANGTYTLSVSDAESQTVTLLDYTEAATATPTSSSTVLGETGGVVKRFAITNFSASRRSAKYYGVTADGSTDDSSAINLGLAALDDSGGGVLELPPGICLVGAASVGLYDNVPIAGAGQKATTLKLANGANIDVLNLKAGQTGAGSGVYALTVDGNDANNTAGGVFLAGANSGRGPTFVLAGVTITGCAPCVGGTALGVSGALVTTGSTWGTVWGLDITGNQKAVGWIHRGSDWDIWGLYLGPNGATLGAQNMIIQGGAGNRLWSPYFGGNGGLEQVRFWGASRNFIFGGINDNAWECAYRFADLAGVPCTDNGLIGGQVSSAGWKTNNTYDAISFEDASSGNFVESMSFLGLQANKARYYIAESGTATNNHAKGGKSDTNYGTGFANLSAGSSYENISGITPAQATATAAAIADKTNAVNTANKYVGKQVWDSTNNRMMRAAGATDVSAWYVLDGSASVTPA